MRVAEWKISQNSCATEQTDDNVPRLDRNEIPNDITIRIHGQSAGEVGQGGGAVNPRDKIGGRHFFFSSTPRRPIPFSKPSEGHHLLLFFRRPPYLRGRWSFLHGDNDFQSFLSLSLAFAPFFSPREESSIIEYRLVGREVEGTEITPFVLRRCTGETINIEGSREWSDIIEEGKIEGWEISRRGDWRVEVLLRNENWEISRD